MLQFILKHIGFKMMEINQHKGLRNFSKMLLVLHLQTQKFLYENSDYPEDSETRPDYSLFTNTSCHSNRWFLHKSFKMKLRGIVLKRIRFSCKNIIVFGVKYKIKTTEDSFDLFLCESFMFLPTTFSECQKKVPLVTSDWIMCGHVTQHGLIRFYHLEKYGIGAWRLYPSL